MPSSVRWPEERRPRLDGVERVLAEHERAGGGRRPRVDERDLDRAEALGRARDEAARLVVDEAHARIAIEVAGEVAEPPVDGADDVLVDVDGGDRPRAEGERREHVAPAAGADHQRVVARCAGSRPMFVTSYFRCSTAPEIAVEAASSRSRPRRRCRAAAGAAAVGGTRRLRPHPCAGSSARRIAHHAHARIRVPLARRAAASRRRP